MRILITGGRGQLGRALARRAIGHEIMAPHRSELDIARLEARDLIADARPDIVVNAAAFTDVDACETQQDDAFRINALGARYVALGAAKAGASLVQVSTDYVFDGRAERPYWEFDPTSPLSVYGRSKLAGEQEAVAACARTYIARTAWLYGLGGRSFVTRMIELSETRDRLEVVESEVGCPTFCDDLADAILKLADTEAFGTYHLVSEGWCSRFEFARAILDAIGRDQLPISPLDHYPRAAQPPAYAPLRNFAAAELGILLPDWQDGLRRFLLAFLEPVG